MKNHFSVSRALVGLFCLLGGIADTRADITVRLSVKFILHPNGTRPSGGNGGIDISTIAGFNAEILRGNQALERTGRGYRIEAVEYLDAQPPVPAGQAADYWFNLNARANRAVFEAAALADRATWRWSTTAINVYVNNTGSGQCSLNNGSSISLGGTIFAAGTLVHELGHFFDLRHTHSAADSNGEVGDWGNGDNLAETLDDDPDASLADINARYPGETQRTRDDLFYNVMSYHREERLLPDQMDIWGLAANGTRLAFCRGRTWFVAEDGSDGNAGISAGFPVATVGKALSKITTPDDAILIRAGTYRPPSSGVIDTACSLRSTRGEVNLHRP